MAMNSIKKTTVINRMQRHYDSLLQRTRNDPIPQGIGLCRAFANYLNITPPSFLDADGNEIEVSAQMQLITNELASRVVNSYTEAIMHNEDGFLEGSEIKKVLKGLQKQANDLIGRYVKQAQAEEALKVKREQLDADGHAFIETLLNAGITSIKLADGTELTVKEKHHLSVLKNEDAIREVTEFLRKHNAEHLLNGFLKVSPNDADKLSKDGIDFSEVNAVNTNSVKAWLIDQMGLKGGEVYIRREDLPKGLAFYTEKVLSTG